MKQVLQNFKTGELGVHDVPVPLLQPGGVIVRTHYSLISAGTEGGTVRLAKKNLLDKARARPDLVGKVVNLARTDGVMAAYEAVVSNLDAPVPLGYSASGEVVEVGNRVGDLKVGDRVACFGVNVANHAECNFVPRNMCVRVPDDANLQHSAFGMVGAIALNGVRRANVQLGGTALVIGLGLIGQLTVQLLRAAGCRVFGIDLDSHKTELAAKLGTHQSATRDEANVEEAVLAFSDGSGVDATIITAASPTSDPIELAGRVTRRRGCVVALGRVPYELPRDEYLFKEIEFATTFSYGPGVNDPAYEKKGVDYPAAFVRWSGNRNVGSFLDLVADSRLNLEPLITHEFSVDDATDAFDLLAEGASESTVAILLRYDTADPFARQTIQLDDKRRTTKALRSDQPQVGVIGAGSHAVSYLLDAISEQNVELRGIVSAGGSRSKWYGEKYGFCYAASDVQEIFDDEQIDVVFVLSRHDSHADLTTRALKSGKHVFVEKPLCLTAEDLDCIVTAHQQSDCELIVGYNRRFATLGQKLQSHFASRAQPMVISYRMNAGQRPADHWLHDLEIGGGLILGEAVHFIDFMQFLTGSKPKRVTARSTHGQAHDTIDDANVAMTVEYADGSLGVMTYLSNGDKSFGRERVEVCCDNTIAVLEDWRRLVISKDGKQKKTRHVIRQQKGFQPEVAAFIQAISNGDPTPISFSEIVDGMQTAFAALESLRSCEPVSISDPIKPVAQEQL